EFRRGDVPEVDGAVGVTGSDEPTVVGEAHTSHPCLRPREDSHPTPGGNIPQPHLSIIHARPGQELAIGREGDFDDRFPLLFWSGSLMLRGKVPDLHLAIHTACS